MRGIVFAVPIAVFLAIAVFFYAGLDNGSPTLLPSALVERPAPDFVMQPFDPEFASFSSADLKQGGPVLVNFWASWCAPCRLEAPVLEQLAERGDLTIYGVAYKDDTELAREFLTRFGNPFNAIAADPEGRAGIEWGITGVPETFVIDGNGIVRYRFAGPLTEEVVEDLILPAAGL